MDNRLVLLASSPCKESESSKDVHIKLTKNKQGLCILTVQIFVDSDVICESYPIRDLRKLQICKIGLGSTHRKLTITLGEEVLKFRSYDTMSDSEIVKFHDSLLLEIS